MRRSSFGLLGAAAFAALASTLLAAPAFAKPPKKPAAAADATDTPKADPDKDKPATPAPDADTPKDAAAAPDKDAKKPDEEKPKAEPASESSSSSLTDTREDPRKSYYFVNLRFRDIVVPKFMINIFADGGATVNAASVGPELTRRKDGVEMDFALSYADYSMNPFLFKGKSDGEEAYELVSSTLKLWYATIDLLYEIPLDTNDRFALLIGGGVGFAGVTGDLYRNQVYPTGTAIDPNNPASVQKCTAPGNPGRVGPNGIAYCDGSNGHYGSYSEPSWAHGGSLPFIFPWIALPQISFRFKPIKQVQIRADVGFSTSGFYFGLSGGYGLPIGGLASDGGNSSSPKP